MSLIRNPIFRKILSLTFTILLLANISSIFVNLVSAQPVLTLKWSRSLGQYAKTYIGALAADINNDGKMEIVVTGGTSDGGTDGTVTALDGATGNIVWQVSPGGIGMHTSFDIVDLDNDGNLEIVISTTGQGLLVLNAKDGSVKWRNTAVHTDSPPSGLTNAIADIDGDGYMEIYVSGGRGPYEGYDYITMLSYNGTILRQTICWHPCWGGLTIGDPAFNGTFILFQGDRASDFGYPTDPYKGGGWGVRALDARTLTPLWNDSSITCSSHVPMLADVDKDGILDVIVVNQGTSNGGVAVYNALTGSVLTTGGKTRKTLSGYSASHSQPTVADVDNDGNLEIIACRTTNPKIWDLYEWRLEATLPVICVEPPKVGDVTGDGKLDIIATTNSSEIYIFTYDEVSKTYVQVDRVANSANAFTLVQDVDGDGYNELVTTSAGGTVRCYDTPAPTPNPKPRTNIQFYSEYHCGAAVYVPSPGPKAPQITEPSPSDGATNVPISLSQLSFKLTDFQRDPINYTVTTNPDIGSASGINARNGKIIVPVSGLAYSTTYTWTVTATDGTHTTTKTFTFTTSDLPPWYITDWQYRRTIMIDHTKVSGDQTNFPVLIDITDSNFIAKAQPDGHDFVFTDQDNNKLNHQIEYYDNTAGRLIAWVNIPYLSSTADTKIYLYYGNPTCGNQQNPKAVWDTSYKLVLHLNEKSGTHYDSTAYGNNGTPINGVQQGVNAKIDGGDTFDGTNDYIEIAHSDTLAGYTEALTVSFWIRLEDTGRRQAIINKYNTGTNQRGWFVEYNPVDRPTRPFGFYASPDGTNYREWYASFVPAANTWYYVTVVWEANKVPIFYINGVQVPTVGTATISEIYNNVGVPLHIARSTYNSARYFKGSLDEIRISNPARSAGYILTSYNNQLNPSAFYTVSREESLLGEPIISNPNPPKDATNVPITLTELSFTLTDYQHDPMNFTVTTNPDIGSRTEYNVESKTYTVPISGLKYAKTYTWTITATDGTYTTTKTFKFTVEPAPPADDVIFDSNFDMGNLINITYVEGRAGYRHYKAATNYTTVSFSDKHWWFYFSMENASGKTIAVSIVNGTDADWSTSPTAGNRWPEIEPVYSYDNINWYRVPLSGVSYDRTAKVFTINIIVPPEYEKVWLAPLPPYNIARRDALFAEFAGSPYLTVTSLGTTPGGQQLLVATITDPAYPDEIKFRSYVIAQQHSGEVPGSWCAEGLIRFLLSDDPTAAAIRRNFIFRIVPIVNVDGVYYGVSRYTPLRGGVQYDLNRWWNTNPITNAPFEVQKVFLDIQAFNPHSFNDLHSTINTEQVSPKEALTYTWSTTDTTLNNFLNKIKEAGWPETVRAVSTLAGGAFQNVRSRLGVTFSLSWENPHDELSTKPGVKLTVYDWMSWGAAWAKGNYLYFGDAQPWLKDPKFDESVDSNDLRDNSAGQDWYESRSAFSGGDPTLLTLNTSNIGGNTGKKAALKNYGIASNAYLTQEFRTTITGTFTISFDIYIDRIEDNGNYDRVGHIYIGDDRNTTDAPTGRSDERFVILAFYDPTPGDTGTDLEIRARTTSGQSWSDTRQWLQVATGLSYDTWYTIKLVVKVANGTYDVYVNGELKMANIPKYGGYSPTSVLYVTFAADSDARGDFYIDNVYSPAQERYRLKVTTIGNGSVTVNPSESTYGKGDTVTLNAVPEPGWVFSHWEGNLTGIQNPATITITSNMDIIAVFTQGQYTLTVNIIGGGQVQIDPLKAYYTYGEEVNLTAIPDEGYDFAGWSGDLTGTDNPQTLIIDGNKTVTANFTLKQFTITAQVLGEGGKITPSGTITVFYGQNQTFLITPDIGYHVSDVIVDGTSVGSVSSYTFYDINDNHIITAKFALNQYTLTINIIGGGTVSKNPDKHYYTHGETVNITAVPDQNWTFSGWSGPISGLTNPTTITITENITVSATFTLNNWWNRDWQYRRTITIDRTKVNGELTNFPVLIEIIDSSLVGKTQQNGEDFVFTDANNVKLDHQIEFYDSATGHLIVWVKVSSLSQTTDTVLYMYYGNPNCGNQQNPTAVWDTSYKLVLHLNEQAGIHYDSTINANNGTPRNGVQQGVTAKIDGGDYFDGIDDYIEIPHSGTLAGYTEALTISFWVKFEDTSRRQTILGKYNTATNQRGWFVDYNPTGRSTRPLGFYASWDGTNYREWYANFVPLAGVWYHITIVWEANKVPIFYINGAQVSTVNTATIPLIYNNVGVPLLIARSPYDNTRHFKGYLDEITISNPARSANWILTTYNNQLNPSAFYSISPEEQFEEAYVLTITIEEEGTVHIDPQKTAYKQGENVTLTAIPGEGYEFAGWSGDITSQETNITITITKNTFITANFTLKQYIINATVSGTGGTIQPSGLITVYHGENVTFTITPDTGYHIEDVKVDDISRGPLDNYTFYSVNANHTIIAFFAPNQYTLIINISPTEGGTVYTNKTAPYYYGDVVELTAVANEGWYFSHWEGNLSGNNPKETIVIDGNKMVTAVFTQNQPPIIETYYPEDLTPEVYEGESLEFSHVSRDPEGQPLSYKWLLDGYEKATTQNWTYTPTYNETGLHIIILIVSDGQLTTRIQWNVTVINVNRPPEILYYSPTEHELVINEGQNIEFTQISVDPDDDPISYRWLLNGTEQSTSQNWTLTTNHQSAGFYTVTLEVSDGEFTVIISWNVTVLNVNRPPQIYSRTPEIDPTIIEGESQEFSITTNDPDGDALLIEWYVNNSLVKVNATTFTFTSNYTSAGIYNITVKVSDGLEQATHQWTLTVLDVGLVLDMPFDTDANPTPDNSGYGNNGTVQGATWTTAGNGSYYFDGVDDYIVIADADSLDGNGDWDQITIEFWIYITAEQRGTRIIAKRHGSADSTDKSYQVGFQSNTSRPANILYFGIYNTGYYEVEYSTPLILRTWYHIVCTYNNATGSKIYINGQEVQVTVTDQNEYGNVRASTQPLCIGRTSTTTSGGFFTGLIDDVKIYFKALPESQIVKHYIESKDAHVNTAPIILSYSPENLQPQVVAGGTLQFTHTSIDPERDPLTYTWLLDGIVKANTQSWTYQPTNSEVGFHNVTLVVSDGSLNAKIEWNVTVLENNPPTITAYTPTIDYPCINQGNRQTFTVTASDPDGDPITYEWYLNNNQVSTTDTYAFDATSGTSGAHTITIIIKDSHGAQTSRKWYLTVDANLVMPFDTNATPVVDYAGYNNNGTVNGATWTADGEIGGCYIFDGIDDYILIPHSNDLDGGGQWYELTIEVWIYLTADQTGTRVLGKMSNSSEAKRSYQIGFQSSSPANRLYGAVVIGSNSYQEVGYNTPLSTGVWYHVVLTYKSGDRLKLYLNGQLVAQSSSTLSGNIQASPDKPLYIGCRFDGGYFKGKIDEVRIYPKALTPNQISQSYLQAVSLLEDCSPITVQTGNAGSATNLLATSTLPLIFAVAILSKRKRKIRISQLNPSFLVANINV